MRASEVYAEKRARVLAQLEDIRYFVDQHGAPDSEIDRDWGYVGDLGYVSECLRDIQRFLRNDEDYEPEG